MDINQIISFLAMAETLDYQEASRRASTPQSVLSRHMDAMGKELGSPLFSRKKKEFSLTEEGEAFVPFAKNILENYRAGAQRVRQMKEGATGHLSIATVDASGAFLRECLERFAKKYPDIAVEIKYISGGDPLPQAARCGCDFYLLNREMLTDSADFGAMDVFTDNLALVLPRGHKLAPADADFVDVQNEKVFLMSEQAEPVLYTQVMELFQSYRIHPRILNRFDDVRAALLSVASGMGVIVLPQALAEEILPEKVVCNPLEGEKELVYSLAWPSEMLNPAARLFLEIATKVVEEFSE